MSKGIDKYLEEFESNFLEKIKPVVEEVKPPVEIVNEQPTTRMSNLKDAFKETGDIVYLREAYQIHLLEYKVDPKELPWTVVSKHGDSAVMTTRSGEKVKGYIYDQVFYYRAAGNTYGFKHPDLKGKESKKQNDEGAIWAQVRKHGEKHSFQTARGNSYNGYIFKGHFYYLQNSEVKRVPADKVKTKNTECAGVGTAEISSPSKVTGYAPTEGRRGDKPQK